MTTNINQGIKTVLYSAVDINRAKALFTKLLGVEPSVDSPYYVGFNVGDQDIGITPNTPPGPAAFGSLYYFATIDDPFRSEGEMFEDMPFLLAAWLCFLPLTRASLRCIRLGTATDHVTENA